MAKNIVYISVEGYMRQWLVHKYGAEPIAFRKWSKENDLLQESLRPKPEGWKPEARQGSIAIAVPKRDGFNPKKWCYIPQQKLVILRQILIHQFRRDFFEFIAQPNPSKPTIKMRVLEFMKKRNIKEDSSVLDTLLKIRQRNKANYQEPTDVDLRKNKSQKGRRKVANKGDKQ